MKSDITSREDIKFIIVKFYDKLLADTKMLPFFEEFVQQNTLDHHLEIITDFWQDLLFQTYEYKNNPMKKHLDFNKKMQFQKQHFTLWIHYLETTIDDFFTGEIANTMKTRATSIATVMQLKMNLYKS